MDKLKKYKKAHEIIVRLLGNPAFNLLLSSSYNGRNSVYVLYLGRKEHRLCVGYDILLKIQVHHTGSVAKAYNAQSIWSCPFSIISAGAYSSFLNFSKAYFTESPFAPDKEDSWDLVCYRWRLLSIRNPF